MKEKSVKRRLAKVDMVIAKRLRQLHDLWSLAAPLIDCCELFETVDVHLLDAIYALTQAQSILHEG